MTKDDYKLINERIGVFSAVALLVGTALGMSIFVVPTQMTAEAGPSITLAILVSIVPMVLGVLLLLQLGGAIPVAGGIYVYGSRLVGPLWGLVAVILPVLAVWAYLLFASLGFAQYLPVLFEVLSLNVEIPTFVGAWILLLLFLLLNYVGIQIVARAQIALVGVLLLGMLTFVAAGFVNFNPDNLTPLFPSGEGEPFAEGITPFVLAVVLLYIPFQGFGMIIEIGEELENPVKNIPRVLAIGMGLVTVLSVAIVVALVGAVPWEETINPETGEAVEGGLATVMIGRVPPWTVAVIAVGALVAAATTVNTLFTSYSRTVMRAARDEVVPDYFAAIHERFHTPHRSILLLGVPPIVAAPFTGYFDGLVEVDFLDWLIVVVVTGIFVAFMIGGVALWNLPKIFPQRYEYSIYKLPMPVLKVVAVGNVVVSFVFMLLVATSAPTALAVVLGWIALGVIAYFARIRYYENRGVDLRERMALLHKHERVGGGSDEKSD
ncbi:MAG: APC family permease [Halobacteriales archaeon]|nr:APC family permease [Halobacteriales archaeon]